MDVAAATLILAVGLTTLVAGLFARVRNVTLAGTANVLAASLLFPHSGVGLRHYVTFVVLAVLVFVVFKSSLNRETWQSIRVEVLLGLAIVANIWLLALFSPDTDRELQLGLLVSLGVMTTGWIGLILVRIGKEHLGQRLTR